MGMFDQAARFAAQADPSGVPTRVLTGAGLPLVFREWFDTRTIPLPGGPDRIADLVAALDNPVALDMPWLLVLEFQAQIDPDKLDVTLEEVAVLRARVRHGSEREGRYKVAVGFVYMLDRCVDDSLDMRLPDGSGIRYTPRIWNIADDNAAATLEAVASGSLSWGMLFWVPLMAGGGEGAVIARWKEVVTSHVEDRSRRGDLVAIAEVFAELAGNAIAWKRALEGFDMTESQVVKEWMAKGVTTGRLTERREMLLRFLNGRFPGVVPADVTKLINEQESLDLLLHWIDASAKANTFQDFMAVLKQ
jgi:hypothetical protein